MTDVAISLPDLEKYMERRNKRKLSFPPELEVQYQQEIRSYRKAVVRHLTLPTILIYNAFLLANYLLVPATLWLATILHFAVVTPCILMAFYLYQRELPPRLREGLVMLVPVLMVGQIMLIYGLNDVTEAAHYHYLAIFIVVYMNVNMRLGYRFAVASTLLMAAIYLGVLLPGSEVFGAKFVGATGMAAVCHLTLLGSLRMERELRHAFLTRLRERLRRMGAEEIAIRDPLTGLSNRRHLDDVIEGIWATPAETSPVAIIIADIDHFKKYNDSYGHQAGDTCLKRVAGVLSAELRDENDTAVRYGGEEFLVVMPGTGKDTALMIAERIRRSIEGLAIPHRNAESRSVTASFGVVVGDAAEFTATELIAEADKQLYEAKNRGRNCISPAFFSLAADSAERVETTDRTAAVATA